MVVPFSLKLYQNHTYVLSSFSFGRGIICLFEETNKEMASRFFDHWKDWARKVKSQLYALYLAYNDPWVPWYAKAFCVLVLAYALSPLDLIPDFIPVLGHLDDVVLIPLGITLAIKMIPKEVMEESRKKAETNLSRGSVRTWPATVVIVFLWMTLLALIGWKVFTK